MADKKIQALKAEITAEVEKRQKFTQEMVDMIFSFGELGFQAAFGQAFAFAWCVHRWFSVKGVVLVGVGLYRGGDRLHARASDPAVPGALVAGAPAGLRDDDAKPGRLTDSPEYLANSAPQGYCYATNMAGTTTDD